MIGEVLIVKLTSQFQLVEESPGIYPDSHGRELERAVQHRVPDKEISVEAAMRCISGR
jgi:hypothetical protein